MVVFALVGNADDEAVSSFSSDSTTGLSTVNSTEPRVDLPSSEPVVIATLLDWVDFV